MPLTKNKFYSMNDFIYFHRVRRHYKTSAKHHLPISVYSLINALKANAADGVDEADEDEDGEGKDDDYKIDTEAFGGGRVAFMLGRERGPNQFAPGVKEHAYPPSFFVSMMNLGSGLKVQSTAVDDAACTLDHSFYLQRHLVPAVKRTFPLLPVGYPRILADATAPIRTEQLRSTQSERTKRLSEVYAARLAEVNIINSRRVCLACAGSSVLADACTDAWHCKIYFQRYNHQRSASSRVF
jgi:hypothetical protein